MSNTAMPVDRPIVVSINLAEANTSKPRTARYSHMFHPVAQTVRQDNSLLIGHAGRVSCDQRMQNMHCTAVLEVLPPFDHVESYKEAPAPEFVDSLAFTISHTRPNSNPLGRATQLLSDFFRTHAFFSLCSICHVY